MKQVQAARQAPPKQSSGSRWGAAFAAPRSGVTTIDRMSEANEQARLRVGVAHDTTTSSVFASAGQGLTAATTGNASCGGTSDCPANFCQPVSEWRARLERDLSWQALEAAIGIAVSPRVVVLWHEYIFGGTSTTKDLTSTFGADFAKSADTLSATIFLANAIRRALVKSPPSLPLGATISLDLSTLIPSEIAELDDPATSHKMEFNTAGEIPANLAGGIGKNQASCRVGNQPSSMDDSRSASGTVEVTQSGTGLLVTPQIVFHVEDTIDLCPGNCGAGAELIATVPMSTWEASGISGDVPFTVDFPAPDVGQLRI